MTNIPAMAELEHDRNLDILERHAHLKLTESATACNESFAEVQQASALHWGAKARRADAIAGLIRAVTVLLVLLAIGWSVWSWVVMR